MALNKKLIPNYNYDLIRLGDKYDGGYLVERESVKNSEFLIGLGICDDWSFEKDFGIDFIGFDNQLNKYFLKNEFYKRLRKCYKFYDLNRLKEAKKYWKKYKDYKRLREKFFQKSIGYNLNDHYISLEVLLDKYAKDKKNIFLKCDIEGSEYRILDQIIKYQDLFTGLVIEFHDIDLYKDTILNFVDKFSHTLVHCHPNNCGGVDDNNDPLVIELTFAKSPKKINEEEVKLPHLLDNANNKDIADIKLNY